MENIIKLHKLQQELGYANGEVSAVALLGLFGEAGEVLNEVTLGPDELPLAELVRKRAVAVAENTDELQKAIRERKSLAPITVHFKHSTNRLDFNCELADVLYYLNALAINQGLTLDNLAELAISKVKMKQENNQFIGK